ncbi:MAG: choice-of-anchor tandem repeat GloVer-containing protein, partial [Ginsengibacter sp.]
MKKILLSVSYFLACIVSMQAQTLYSITTGGGTVGLGTIIKFLPAINNLSVSISFASAVQPDGNTPSGSLIRATDHKLYGMTTRGGSNGYGTIFSFDPLSGTYTKLMDFNNTDGAGPLGSLIQAKDEKLYGMTHDGGGSNAGVIFSFDPSSGTYVTLMDFNNSNGARPSGNLMQAGDGKLYGMTTLGGTNGSGVIFSFDPSTSAYVKLIDFNPDNGGNPSGSLIQANNGKLYGMTNQAGNLFGVIFSFDPASSTLQVLKYLQITNDGSNPQGSLIQASDGKFYGMMSGGGSAGLGVIFSFDPTTSISPYTVLKQFDNTGGANPLGNLLQASNGKMYGMTSKGGSNDAGVVFSFDPSSKAYTKLIDYDGTNGAAPGLGAAFIEGHDCIADTVYYKDADSDGFGNQVDSVVACSLPVGYIANNTDCDDFNPAVHPGAKEVCNGIDDDCNGLIDDGLVFITYYRDADGDGYGTGAGQSLCQNPGPGYATRGGDCDDNNGAIHPGAPEICNGIDDNCDGKVDENCSNIPSYTLYGTTGKGGSAGGGTIGTFIPSTYNLTVARSFGVANSLNGSVPTGDLLQASDGKVYGMTSDGGSNHSGIIFSFDPATSTYTKLEEFDSANGRNPLGSLIQASDGKLYGMTQFGGSNDIGIIFSFDPSTSSFTRLKDFDNTNGSQPHGSLLQANDGKLYGMTQLGGSKGIGVIFSFDPSSSSYMKLHDFDTTNGAFPTGNLIQANDGKLYGLTSHGGTPFDDCGGCGNFGDGGVIFSYDLSTNTFTNLMDFTLNQGENPTGSLLQAKDGKLYGMTGRGGFIDNKGDFGFGAIFSFDPTNSNYLNLKNFDPGTGTYPTGNLMQASDKKLYGMTSSGGLNDDGIIFSFDPASSAFTTLKDLDTSNGAKPHGSLIQYGDGKLYSMTSSGGNGNLGIIFSIDPSSSVYAVLKDFGTNEKGSVVSAALVQAHNNMLYGMTYEGGSNGAGLIFSFDPTSLTYTKLKDFDGINGGAPSGSLMQGSDGKLYGTTSAGGNSDKGVIFSFDLFSSTYKKLQDFDGTNGANPNSGFIELLPDSIAPTVALTTPANNATYLAGGNVYLKAIASDADGTISKVEFYHDTTLLYTAIDTPYNFKWEHVYLGDYILTAKATDNDGLVTTSAKVHISVVRNKPPTVSIITPADHQIFTAAATGATI